MAVIQQKKKHYTYLIYFLYIIYYILLHLIHFFYELKYFHSRFVEKTKGKFIPDIPTPSVTDVTAVLTHEFCTLDKSRWIGSKDHQ